MCCPVTDSGSGPEVRGLDDRHIDLTETGPSWIPSDSGPPVLTLGRDSDEFRCTVVPQG